VPFPTSTPPTHVVSVQGSTLASTAGSHHGSTSGWVSVAPATGPIERTAPCRRSQTSGGISSHRSTIAAARRSVPRASAFSSSVRVSTRRARISSISVASQKSPALSGATAGWS